MNSWGSLLSDWVKKTRMAITYSQSICPVMRAALEGFFILPTSTKTCKRMSLKAARSVVFFLLVLGLTGFITIVFWGILALIGVWLFRRGVVARWLFFAIIILLLDATMTGDGEHLCLLRIAVLLVSLWLCSMTLCCLAGAVYWWYADVSFYR